MPGRWKNLVARWGAGAGETDDVRMDAKSSEIIVIQNEHHEVHEGCLFYFKDVVDAVGGAGSNTYFMFTPPDTTEEIHAKVIMSGASAEFDVRIFEGGTTSADGTPVTFLNANRNSLNTSSLVGFAGPTVTTDGLEIWHAKVGVGKSAGVSNELNYEIIAKRNTKYLFKLTKVAATAEWLDVDFFSYQHTPIN